MENPIFPNRNPNPNAGNQIHSLTNSADDQDRKLQRLFSAVQNLAVSRDSSYGAHRDPPTPSKSGRRPMQTDFFREVSLVNAHFGSEPERSRWAQFLPDYLRPGNLENYLKQTKKPQLFGNNFWRTSRESSEQDCNSRLATINQRRTPRVPDGQKDIQSSKPCSRRIDRIQYSRDQLLQHREVKTVPGAILKIKQGIEVEFRGVKKMIDHGTTIVEKNGTKRESELTLKEKKEDKKTGNINVKAKQELKMGEKAAIEEGVSKKRKRGVSDERKAKKKMKERKKRAEKNRKLGVKRLKIQPIVKEKPVSHCRHYMHGRCYEGDACKFSHDVVPFTKSKPCSHFARQACMKGDDCPFDHQLSKYPCNNYASTGSCYRGESCLFSHEITPKPDSAPVIDTMKPETKSLKPSPNSGSIEQVKKSVDSGSSPLKGLTFPLGASAKQKQTNLSQKSHFAFEASAPTSTTKKSSPQPYTPESITDNILTSKVNQPVRTPKGLTFLNTGSLQKNESARDEKTPQKTGTGVEASVLPNQVTVNNVAKIGEEKQSNFPTFVSSSLVASGGEKKNSDDLNQKPNVVVPFLKLPASASSSSPLLTRLESSQVKNLSKSGQRSLLSTLGFASKCVSGGTRNSLIGTPALGTEVTKSRESDHSSGTQ